MSLSLLPLPHPCSPPITSYATAIIVRLTLYPPLPRRGCSCYPYKRPAIASGCDWVSSPLPLSLLSSGVLSLLFCLTCSAPCALAFSTALLCLLPREGADILDKLVLSVSSPRIQTSHWFVDQWGSDVVQWLGCKWHVSRYDRWRVQERLGTGLERGKNGF